MSVRVPQRAAVALAFGFMAGLVPGGAFARPVCTLVVEADDRVLHREGRCEEPESPASTFKIALAVMGYDAGVLIGPHEPVWPTAPNTPPRARAGAPTSTRPAGSPIRSSGIRRS